MIDADALDFLADVANGDARSALNAIELGILTTEKSGMGRSILRWAWRQNVSRNGWCAMTKAATATMITFLLLSKACAVRIPMRRSIIWRRCFMRGGCGFYRPADHDLRLGGCGERGSHGSDGGSQRGPGGGAPRYAGGQDRAFQAATYVASAPKSNAAYLAVDRAMEVVRQSRTAPVPPYLCDKPLQGRREVRAGHRLSLRPRFPQPLCGAAVSAGRL